MLQTNTQILAMTRPEELRVLRYTDFREELSRRAFEHIFDLLDAYWQYEGEPCAEKPHALLTTGLHSNGFFDVLKILRRTNLCMLLADQVIRKFHHRFGSAEVTWVVGSDHAAVALSHAIAILLGCNHESTEKGPNKSQVWNREFLKPGDVVLHVEDLVTTTDTSVKVNEAIQSYHPFPVRFANIEPVVVHRSDTWQIGDIEIAPLFHYEIKNFSPGPETCPYCTAGSEAIRPKQADNWARLKGRAVTT